MIKRWCQWALCSALMISLAGVLFINLRLVATSCNASNPQAILVLGGSYRRELTAAQLASQKTDLEVWVSSGMLPPQANKIFITEDVSLSRVNLDYRATDTVTNFTTLVSQLQANNIQHIYLITSDFHMPRATSIAFWVLGSRGIAYTPVAVPSHQSPEPYHKIFRDVVRSWLWLLTGRTGSSLDPSSTTKSS
ncbi:MAG: YdcF family protein [Cyanobacteria bacterium P01_B01_bin.77]